MGSLVYNKEFDFIPKLQLSKARRAVNYTLGDYSTNTLPKRFRDKNCNYKYLKNEFCWKENKLYNLDTKSFEIRNPRTVGKPKYWVINGQSIYNGKMSPLQRSNIVNRLHEYFKELIKDCPKLDTKITSYKSPEVFRLHYKLVLTWYILEDKVYPDVNNLWIYDKVILDVMVKDLNVIPDDNHEYVHEIHKKYEYKDKEGFKIEIWKV